MLSYCGLIAAKIRASDKDLPVRNFLYLKGNFVTAGLGLYITTFGRVEDLIQ